MTVQLFLILVVIYVIGNIIFATYTDPKNGPRLFSLLEKELLKAKKDGSWSKRQSLNYYKFWLKSKQINNQRLPISFNLIKVLDGLKSSQKNLDFIMSIIDEFSLFMETKGFFEEQDLPFPKNEIKKDIETLIEYIDVGKDIPVIDAAEYKKSLLAAYNLLRV